MKLKHVVRICRLSPRGENVDWETKCFLQHHVDADRPPPPFLLAPPVLFYLGIFITETT